MQIGDSRIKNFGDLRWNDPVFGLAQLRVKLESTDSVADALSI